MSTEAEDLRLAVEQYLVNSGNDRRMAIFTTEARKRIAQDEQLAKELGELGDRQLRTLFEGRKSKYFTQEQVKNADMWANTPMFFYCQECGVNHAILSEDYLKPAPKLCVVCTEMQRRNLL